MQEDIQARYQERLGQLIENAQKKKNVLDNQEVIDAFGDLPLQPEA